MFADIEDVQPDSIGELSFDNHVSKHFSLREQTPVRINSDISERIQTQLNRGCHVPPSNTCGFPAALR
jgi:hypothetical protein